MRDRTERQPRTAVVWTVLRAELARRAHDAPLRILDAGGGTGGFAVPLAEAGHHVTVIDPSPDALAALARRAAERDVADRVTAVQGDTDAIAGLVEPKTIDLALCHSVLEVVDDPAGTLAAVAAVLRPGGCVSLLVANQAAAVFGRAVGGHFSDALALLTDPAGPTRAHDTVRRRFDVASASALAAGVDLTVEQVHGIRVFADLIPGALADSEPDTLLALERAAAETSPYRDLATQLHLLARRS